MKKYVQCIKCGKWFWSKAKKNKILKTVDALNNMCQRCLNELRQQSHKRREPVRVFTKEIQRLIEKEEIKRVTTPALLTTPFNTVKRKLEVKKRGRKK